MSTFTIILDYCGSERTDRLVEDLRRWNPGYPINVLDNASPRHPCRYCTHKNYVNTNVGGGINDCLRLADEAGARFLLFIVNDAECVTPVRIAHFERLIREDSRIVQVSAAITVDTDQARNYPWMVHEGCGKDRIVPNADFLISMLDTQFVSGFGGFPE